MMTVENNYLYPRRFTRFGRTHVYVSIYKNNLYGSYDQTAAFCFTPQNVSFEICDNESSPRQSLWWTRGPGDRHGCPGTNTQCNPGELDILLRTWRAYINRSAYTKLVIRFTWPEMCGDSSTSSLSKIKWSAPSEWHNWRMKSNIHHETTLHKKVKDIKHP